MIKRLAEFWRNQLLFLHVSYDYLSQLEHKERNDLLESGDFEEVIDAYFLTNYDHYTQIKLDPLCLNDLIELSPNFPLHHFYLFDQVADIRGDRCVSLNKLMVESPNETFTTILNAVITEAFIEDPWGVHLVLEDIHKDTIAEFDLLIQDQIDQNNTSGMEL